VALGCEVGCLPLPSLNSMKFWGQIIFRNTLEHPDASIPLSMPPMQSDYAQWDVPLRLKDDVRQAPKSLFGTKDLGTLELEKFRICWLVLL